MSHRKRPVHQTALPLLACIKAGRFTRAEVASSLGLESQNVTNWLARGIPANVLEEKKDEIYSNAEKSARESVKFKFIAVQIAENEKIEVTNDQVARHLAFVAQREGTTLEKMVDRVRKNNAFGAIQQQLTTQAVLDFLLKEAKFE